MYEQGHIADANAFVRVVNRRTSLSRLMVAQLGLPGLAGFIPEKKRCVVYFSNVFKFSKINSQKFQSFTHDYMFVVGRSTRSLFHHICKLSGNRQWAGCTPSYIEHYTLILDLVFHRSATHWQALSLVACILILKHAMIKYYAML